MNRFVIDAHEDLAYNMLAYGRDYRRSALETRAREPQSAVDPEQGLSTLGWPEMQRGQVAVIFGTLFAAPREHSSAGEESDLTYENYDQAHQIYMRQLDFYRSWCDQSPDMFRLITNRSELHDVLTPWQEQPANPPDVVHPVGLVMLMEGADGVRDPGELELWWQRGLRQIGPAWMGARYCGATRKPGGFTREGFELLKRMAQIGFTLDLSHMSMASAIEAVDRYEGPIIASHSNLRRLVGGDPAAPWGERHLTDEVARLLVERDGVIGLVPFNLFLKGDWTDAMGKDPVTLENSIAIQIDAICQMAGDAHHVGFGTDFDGGFGAQSIPKEMDTIADLQALAPILAGRGYTENDINAIFGGNWQRHLEQHLPGA